MTNIMLLKFHYLKHSLHLKDFYQYLTESDLTEIRCDMSDFDEVKKEMKVKFYFENREICHRPRRLDPAPSRASKTARCLRAPAAYRRGNHGVEKAGTRNFAAQSRLLGQ